MANTHCMDIQHFVTHYWHCVQGFRWMHILIHLACIARSEITEFFYLLYLRNYYEDNNILCNNYWYFLILLWNFVLLFIKWKKKQKSRRDEVPKSPWTAYPIDKKTCHEYLPFAVSIILGTKPLTHGPLKDNEGTNYINTLSRPPKKYFVYSSSLPTVFIKCSLEKLLNSSMLWEFLVPQIICGTIMYGTSFAFSLTLEMFSLGNLKVVVTRLWSCLGY